MTPRHQHVANVGLLFGIEHAEDLLLEQLGEANDGVQRRAQLVAHVGQEGALGLIGGVGGLLGGAQLALGALALLDLALQTLIGVGELARSLGDPALQLGVGGAQRFLGGFARGDVRERRHGRIGTLGPEMHQRPRVHRDPDAAAVGAGHPEHHVLLRLARV